MQITSTALRKPNRGPAAGLENRRALITAAREIFGELGLTAPLNAVAKRARVGQGSLYRHFPDRTALAVAVFEENLAELEEYTASAHRTVDDLLDRVIEQAMVSSAFIELVTLHLADPRVVQLGRRYASIVAQVVSSARVTHRLGEHIDTSDVIIATSMLATFLARTPPRELPSSAARARALLTAAFAPLSRASHTTPVGSIRARHQITVPEHNPTPREVIRADLDLNSITDHDRDEFFTNLATDGQEPDARSATPR